MAVSLATCLAVEDSVHHLLLLTFYFSLSLSLSAAVDLRRRKWSEQKAEKDRNCEFYSARGRPFGGLIFAPVKI